jgi:hypothetical protein
MHIERMFGQGAGCDLQNHGRQLARRVVGLLTSINDALPGGEIDNTFPRRRKCDRASLSGMFSFSFDGNL